MNKERKIAKVVRQVSFAEAEAADDAFWSKASVEERLKELESLRKMLWPNAAGKMKKVVKRRYLYEKEK
jgi:hypothetical protein